MNSEINESLFVPKALIVGKASVQNQIKEGKYPHDFKSIADSGITGELSSPLLDKEDTKLELLSP